MNIVLYTNILTPYRRYFYDRMHRECERRGDSFSVLLMAETEPNRNWHYDELKTGYTKLLSGKTIAYHDAFIHFNPTLATELKRAEPDVLVCAGSYLCPGVWQAARLKGKLHYKTYYWSESHLNEARDYGGAKVALREALRRRVYAQFDGFWYAGKLSREFIEKYSREGADYIFVPNLVEEDVYRRAGETDEQTRGELRRRLSLPEDRTVFFCPARLSPVKGIDRFLPLLGRAKLRERATVLIAGDGELRETISSMAKELGLDVRLLGFQDQKSVAELYAASDFFLLPSLSDPNPLTCIEALWAGLPLLISEHCGNYPEVVCPGENGFVFRYRDGNAADLIDRAIGTDAAWRAAARKTSQSIAAERYLASAAVERIVDSLHERR